MIKKVARLIPNKWLLRLANLFFWVREVKSKKDRKVFHKIWTTVWLEVGYAHEGEPLPEIEDYYRAFEPFSTDLILYFLWTPIGTMRLIWENEEVEIPIFRDFRVEKSWDDTVVEFELLTLERKWRGLSHLPSFILWREGYRRAKEKNYNIVAAVDWRFFRLLRYFFPVRQVGKEKFFQGSVTHPILLDLAEARKTLAENNPQLLRFFDPEAAEKLLKSQEAG